MFLLMTFALSKIYHSGNNAVFFQMQQHSPKCSSILPWHSKQAQFISSIMFISKFSIATTTNMD
jgi:hypothetical protein